VPDGNDGIVSATVSGTDLFGNYYTITATDSITYTIDNVSPTVSITKNGGGTTLGATVNTVEFTLTESSTTFDVTDISITTSGTVTGTLSNFTAVDSVTYTASYVPPTNYFGTVTFTVAANRFYDTAGNSNTASTTAFNVDTLGPEVSSFTASDTQLNVTETTTLTITLTESSTTLTKEDIEYTLNPSGSNKGELSSFSATSSSTYTVIYTPPVSYVGSVTFTIASATFTDIPGNNNTLSSTLTLEIDTVTPTVTLTHDHIDLIVRDADTVELTATFSEAMTNTPTISITGVVTGVAMTASTTSASKTWSYSWDVPDGNDGIVSATVSGTDLFGNYYITTTDSITYTIDNVSPTVSIQEGSNGDNLLYAGVSSITFTLTESSTTFDITDISITASGTATGTLSNFTATTSTSYLVYYTPPINYSGTVTFTVSESLFTDIAGNTNTASSTAFRVDSGTPTVTIVMSDYLVRGSETVTATFYFSEPIQQLPLGNLNRTLSNVKNLVTVSATQYYSEIETYSDYLGEEYIANGTIRVSNFKDLAGNINTNSFSDRYLTDAKLPKISSLEWYDTENYIAEIIFTESVYSNQNSATIDKNTYKNWSDYLIVPDTNLLPLTASSVSLTITSATSSATASISSVTLIEAPQNPNIPRRVFSLTHKSKYRIALTVSGTLQGDEILNFMASTGGSIFDIAGNPMSLTDSKTLQFNQKPVANSYTMTVNEGQSSSFVPTGSDPDEDAISFEIGDQYPSQGSVTISGTLITYNHFGLPTPLEDSFSIKAFDGITYSDNATVTVNIIAQNDPPAISNFPEGFLQVFEGQGLTIQLGPYDEEGDPIESVAIVTSSKYGSLEFIGDSDGDGVEDIVSYQHYGNGTLQDSFSVQAKTTDGQVSSITTLTLTIIPIDDAPVAPDQVIYVDQGESGNYLADAYDEEGDAIAYTLLENPTKGALNWITPEGSFSYAHDFDKTGFEIGNDLYSFVYEDFLTYKVTANGKSSEEGKITIYIIPFDHDQDGVPSREEDLNRNGDFRDDDTDGDGIPNFLDVDDDGDRLLTRFENSFYEDFNGDGDNDGIANYLDVDDDNDGVLTKYEAVFNSFFNTGKYTVKRYKKRWDYNPKTWKPNFKDKSRLTSKEEEVEYPDTDGDGLPDFFDIDDDNDGVLTKYENPDPNGDSIPDDALDSDQETIPNYLDVDDDDDGILTIMEIPDQNGDGVPDDALDSDQEQIPNYLDTDDDNDSILTFFENPDKNGDGVPDDAQDSDSEQIPDYLDVDDDNDTIPTIIERPDQNGDGVPDDALNSDFEDTPNYIDVDDDNDGKPTKEGEDLNVNGTSADDDGDGDGFIDAIESILKDEDQDGVKDEQDSENKNPNNDQDGDGFGNLDETLCGFDPLDPNSYPFDMDADGTVNCLDDDIDGDGVINEFDNDPELYNPDQFYELILEYQPQIPEVFSPNGDGINDTWNIINIERYPSASVYIFTRTGKSVFEMKRYNNSWRGTNNGNPLPEASYYYMVDIDGNESIDFQGWLYLTR